MDFQFIIFFFSILCFFPTASSYEARCLEIGNGMEIKMKPYDTNYQLCCGQSLRQRKPNLECCNNKDFYYSDKKICCNGTVTNRWISMTNPSKTCTSESSDCVERICCGRQLIQKQINQFCCDGQKISLTEDQVKIKHYLKCCGKDNVIDVRDRMCCENADFKKSKNLGCCGNKLFNSRDNRCVNGMKIKKTDSFCNKQKYDKMKDICCNDHLIENTPEIVKVKKSSDNYIFNPNAQCCGSSVISNNNETCCEERNYGYPSHKIPNEPGLMCCGNGAFNNKTQACLNGHAVDKAPNQIPCGNVLIDTSFQDCCANKMPYNLDTHKCCEGASFCVVERDQKCCNGFKMGENEVCCESIKPCKKRYTDDDNCCFDYERENGQTFKTDNETCFRGQITLKKDGVEPCGLHSFYNPKEEYCCNNKKYKKGQGQCCYGIYSHIPANEGSCCMENNRVYRFDDESNPCMDNCDGRPYDISKELCCEGRLFNYTGHNYCCGRKAIDSGTMECCADYFPYHVRSKISCCCDTQLYNKRYSKCLPNGKIETVDSMKGRLDVEKLCSSRSLRLFDGGIEQACQHKFVIAGRVTRVDTYHQENELKVRISLRRVQTLKPDDKTVFPKKLTLIVHIPDQRDDSCELDHLDKLKKLIVMFDERVMRREVVIYKTSSLFINRHSSKRRYAIEKAFSKNLCKIFR